MELDSELFTAEERISFSLRALYREYGYSLYRMSKFEEYDLYARNKDFLISENVITFTDAGGKLMALKPDVTLSIVRSCRDRAGAVQKLCYNENVYRVPHGGGAFRELTQAGVECIGAVGVPELREALMLALRSLERVAAGDWRLHVSHLGVLSALLGRLSLHREAEQAALECIARKSAHELAALCSAYGVDSAAAEALLALTRLSGPPAEVLPALRDLLPDVGAVAELEQATEGMGAHLDLDFSIVSNRNYYNGIVFQGYVSGVPAAVLSGGQYDQLLRKLGRSSRAVGFAVYVDMLERLNREVRA